MAKMTHRNSRPRKIGIAPLYLLLALAFALAACGSKQKPGASPGQRYRLTGKIVSVAPAAGYAVVDAAAIPGYMDAMAMPYSIPDQKALANLSTGDEITADVVVTPDGKDHLENVVVTKKGSGGEQGKKGPSSEDVHQPVPGEKVPDFALVNQDGKRIHFRSFKGDVLLVTFIYTRCPFPDYCPLVSKNFADIYAVIHANPKVYSKVRLLSVSFDPTHDTPEALRKYAGTFQPITRGVPFDRWEFATAPSGELGKITDFFGVFFDSSQKQIIHTLSTSVISPQGTIFKWYQGGDWHPSDLLGDATQILAEQSPAGPAIHAGVRRESSTAYRAGR